MTDQENARLREVLKTIVPKILRDRDRRMSEEDTKIGLIDPVLEALGWNVRDWDEVHHEFRAKAGDNPVDYALKISEAQAPYRGQSPGREPGGPQMDYPGADLRHGG